jgi:hypothetical protein
LKVRGGESLEKKDRTLRCLVYFIIQNPPLKNCIGRGVNFLNSTCCYNTCKIKSKLIMSIHLSFTTKTFSHKF